MEAQLSNNETARLKALYKYQILDTEPEEEFNDIARLAAYICNTPSVLINLIDENRQWFKAKIGMDATHFPRDVGLCLLCIQQRDTVVIFDTLADQRSKANSLVTCDPYIRFYAGVPLITLDGHIIGTLCVLDYVPRSFSPEQVEALQALSRQVVTQLELRRNLKLAPSITKCEQAEEELHCNEQYLYRILKSSTDCIKVLDLEGRLLSMSYQGQLALEIDDFTPYLNLSWMEFWKEADQEAVCFALATAKAGGVGKFQGYCPTAKRKPKWWDVVVTPLMDAKGKPEQLLAVSRDITEWKQAESERERFFSLSLHMLCIGGFDGYFKFLNPAWEKTLGFTKEELLAKPYIEFIHPQDRAATIAESQKLTSGVETIAFENRYLCKDGSYKWLLWNIAPFLEQKLTYCVVHDITQRKRVEEELCEMNLVLENAVEGISRLDTQGRFITVNRAYADKVGYQPEEMLGMEWQATVYPEERENTFAAYQYMLTNGKVEVETRGVRKDGSVFYQQLVMISAYDKQQQFTGHYCFMKDVSERKQTETQLWHQACHDALTGLPNRILFIERLDRAIKRTKRQKEFLFAVLFLDLDRFKVVNDSLGHLIGDQLLIAIAHRLEACLRPTDTVARFGGDEFTILLENIKDINHAVQIAERIQQELTLPFNLSGHEVFTTASIGITLSTTNSHRPEDILSDADTTMYRAKASGKARCEIFDPTMHSQAIARLQLETDLQRALQRQEFELYYQPIVSLRNNQTTGFEALLRWHHPVRGIVPAAEFIPIAEETGLIVPIDWWVLREACQQMRTWQMQFDLNSSITMSVNLSAKQFSQTDFIGQIEKIIHDTTLDCRSLKLEITESVLIKNAQSVSAILLKLQALGIRLSIDDFGTGYSSLSYLHQFPIDTIKIDGSFINNVDIDVEKIEIVRTIVGLAWNLGMDVVAEGVETNKQMYQVKALKCDLGQGYLFSRPLNREAAEALIATKMQS
ncbi:MAG: EAL domain-containing protein [Gloeocapsa sp. UFS-A4-WI-NPMV-4B04]|jgi:diguanylate cyclase (GGDEF)-like protein/PAS domain S-box-containing protein|nr:EAL domain-containing protein [Gloeocapsa sp. UFS-A4-WI-NPMV-4B04]